MVIVVIVGTIIIVWQEVVIGWPRRVRHYRCNSRSQTRSDGRLTTNLWSLSRKTDRQTVLDKLVQWTESRKVQFMQWWRNTSTSLGVIEAKDVWNSGSLKFTELVIRCPSAEGWVAKDEEAVEVQVTKIRQLCRELTTSWLVCIEIRLSCIMGRLGILARAYSLLLASVCDSKEANSLPSSMLPLHETGTRMAYQSLTLTPNRLRITKTSKAFELLWKGSRTIEVEIMFHWR